MSEERVEGITYDSDYSVAKEHLEEQETFRILIQTIGKVVIWIVCSICACAVLSS
jgi:hypothetical protein